MPISPTAREPADHSERSPRLWLPRIHPKGRPLRVPCPDAAEDEKTTPNRRRLTPANHLLKPRILPNSADRNRNPFKAKSNVLDGAERESQLRNQPNTTSAATISERLREKKLNGATDVPKRPVIGHTAAKNTNNTPYISMTSKSPVVPAYAKPTFSSRGAALLRSTLPKSNISLGKSPLAESSQFRGVQQTNRASPQLRSSPRTPQNRPATPLNPRNSGGKLTLTKSNVLDRLAHPQLRPSPSLHSDRSIRNSNISYSPRTLRTPGKCSPSASRSFKGTEEGMNSEKTRQRSSPMNAIRRDGGKEVVDGEMEHNNSGVNQVVRKVNSEAVSIRMASMVISRDPTLMALESSEDKEEKTKVATHGREAEIVQPTDIVSVNERSEDVYRNFGSKNDDGIQWSLKDFQIGKKLGRGKFGHVYRAKAIKGGCDVVLKLIFKAQLAKYKSAHLCKREIEIQQPMSHPNVLRLHGFFQDDTRIYIILDYAHNGELYAHLQKTGKLSEQETAKYIVQLSDALVYCHSRGVIHRDIKPENVLLDGSWNALLCDFGWSVKTDHGKRQTMCGTLDYLPPEMIEGKEHDQAVDFWAIGVLTYECIVGNAPFETSNQGDTLRRIINDSIFFPSFVAEDAQKLILSLMQKNPLNRLPLRKVRENEWIKKTVPHLIEKAVKRRSSIRRAASTPRR